MSKQKRYSEILLLEKMLQEGGASNITGAIYTMDSRSQSRCQDRRKRSP